MVDNPVAYDLVCVCLCTCGLLTITPTPTHTHTPVASLKTQQNKIKVLLKKTKFHTKRKFLLVGQSANKWNQSFSNRMRSIELTRLIIFINSVVSGSFVSIIYNYYKNLFFAPNKYYTCHDTGNKNKCFYSHFFFKLFICAKIGKDPDLFWINCKCSFKFLSCDRLKVTLFPGMN